jgi:hypothetical protein
MIDHGEVSMGLLSSKPTAATNRTGEKSGTLFEEASIIENGLLGLKPKTPF